MPTFKLPPPFRDLADPLWEQRINAYNETAEAGEWTEPTLPNANVVQFASDPMKMRLEYGGRLVRFIGQLELKSEGAGGKGLKTGETLFEIPFEFDRASKKAIWLSMNTFTNLTNENQPIMIKKAGSSREFKVKIPTAIAEEKLLPATDIPFHWISYAIDDRAGES